MTDIAAIAMRDILPPSLATDESMQAIAAALDPEMQALIYDATGAAILPNIPNVPERILDMLAANLSIDEYQQDMTLAQKQALIASAIIVHRHKGTADSIHQIVAAIFGPGMTLQEWHEYGGAPYHFRIIGAEGFPGNLQPLAWTAAVKATKPARSVLDPIVITTEESAQLYVGGTLHVGIHHTFTQGVS